MKKSLFAVDMDIGPMEETTMKSQDAKVRRHKKVGGQGLFLAFAWRANVKAA